MDDDKVKLVKQLCARAGMVLEDTATSAILIGDVPDEAMTVTVAGLRAMAERAVVLLRAAQALGE